MAFPCTLPGKSTPRCQNTITEDISFGISVIRQAVNKTFTLLSLQRLASSNYKRNIIFFPQFCTNYLIHNVISFFPIMSYQWRHLPYFDTPRKAGNQSCLKWRVISRPAKVRGSSKRYGHIEGFFLFLLIFQNALMRWVFFFWTLLTFWRSFFGEK